MALAPLDLQTLFSQVDKVGKAQLSQREGLVLQQAIQGANIQRKTEERVQEVNETQNTGDGAEKVNDRGQRGYNDGAKKGKSQKENVEEEREQDPVFKDPSLGRNIDISL
ncbi:MAG: hypothetical protein LBU82_07005 [Treponema sp.]|jgi:hypothetical protein|nr:hypothetical protein [Treponema sp.]